MREGRSVQPEHLNQRFSNRSEGTPKGQLAVSGDTIDFQNVEGCYWHPVSRGQGCH